MTEPRPDAMRALTVRPPWSWAISHGPKRIENRTRRVHLRGPFAIHAGKGWDWDGWNSGLMRRAWQKAGHDVYRLDPDNPQMTMGAVVAVADLADICSMSRQSTEIVCECGPWAQPGQHHLILADVRPLAEPVPCKGMLGLWRLPAGVEAAVMAQLGEVASRG